jgi:mono/diheme cytochrome c family protein
MIRRLPREMTMGHGLARVAAGAAAMLTALGFITSAGAQGLQADAALVSRGAYLARAGDCAPCHTGDASKPFAGGLALKTPFGTLFSVNITSDPETGIGNWTYAQFKNALHQGIRADGAYLYPGMPFDAYTEIEETDLEALWAYVRRIAPVKAPNRDNELTFPFDVRLGMLAWRELFFAPGYFKPAAGKSAEWNRGAYLVEALGHCSDCHSPRDIMGAVKGKALFTGTEVDGFYAPDIASAALAKTWTSDNLVQFLKTGSSPQRGSVFGPMADVIHDSLSHLTDPDLAAIVTYLLDSPPAPDMPAPQKLSPLAPAVYQHAVKLYVDNCAACHQPHGTGIAGAIPPLAGNPAVTALELTTSSPSCSKGCLRADDTASCRPLRAACPTKRSQTSRTTCARVGETRRTRTPVPEWSPPGAPPWRCLTSAPRPRPPSTARASVAHRAPPDRDRLRWRRFQRCSRAAIATCPN